MIYEGDILRAKVEKLVFGGSGLIRHEGWVIFVDGVIAEELVEIRITEKKKSFFRADLIQVLEPSPFRVTPRCPYFGLCGGCQLQHIDYQEQLKLKVSWLQEALCYASKQTLLPIAIEPAPKIWNYRQKITLHEENGKRGFYAKDNKTIVEIKSCDIYDGDVFQAQKKRTFEYDLMGLQVCVDSTVFMQNSPTAFLRIYNDVLKMAQEPSGHFLELYSGVGILSLLAAKKGWDCLGIEIDANAVRMAKKNAQANHIENAHFLADAAESIEHHPQRSLYRNIWVVNPPRVGLSCKMIDIISGLRENERPEKFFYISCMPSTLARDVKKLCTLGYKIQEVRAYDMFAQTTHLESVVLLT